MPSCAREADRLRNSYAARCQVCDEVIAGEPKDIELHAWSAYAQQLRRAL